MPEWETDTIVNEQEASPWKADLVVSEQEANPWMADAVIPSLPQTPTAPIPQTHRVEPGPAYSSTGEPVVGDSVSGVAQRQYGEVPVIKPEEFEAEQASKESAEQGEYFKRIGLPETLAVDVGAQSASRLAAALRAIDRADGDIEKAKREFTPIAGEQKYLKGASKIYDENVLPQRKARADALLPLLKRKSAIAAKARDMGTVGIVESAIRNWDEKIPFSPVALMKQIDLMVAIKSIERDDYIDYAHRLMPETEEEKRSRYRDPTKITLLDEKRAKFAVDQKKRDVKLVNDFFDEMLLAEARGQTTFGKMAEGLSIMPKWMIEIAMTGGLATAAQKPFGKAARYYLRKYGKSKLKGWAIKAGGRGFGLIAGGIGRTMGQPTTWGAEAVGLGTGTFRVDNGKLVEVVPGVGFGEAVGGSFARTVIANASEMTGAQLTGFLGKFAKKVPGLKQLTGKLGKSIQRMKEIVPGVHRIMVGGGYSNPVGEMLEETVDDIANAALNLNKKYEGKSLPWRIASSLWPGTEEMFVRAVVLSVPMGGQVALSRSVGVLRRRAAREGMRLSQEQAEMAYFVQQALLDKSFAIPDAISEQARGQIAELEKNGVIRREGDGYRWVTSEISGKGDVESETPPSQPAPPAESTPVDTTETAPPPTGVKEVVAPEGVEREVEAKPEKEAWEMTLADYKVSVKGKRLGEVYDKGSLMNAEGARIVTHRRAVEQANREGKDIPAAVLAEYPDLKAAEKPEGKEADVPRGTVEAAPAEAKKEAKGLKADQAEVNEILRKRAEKSADVTIAPEHKHPVDLASAVSITGATVYKNVPENTIKAIKQNVKKILATVPEFAIDPTLTVTKDGKLLFSDHYKFEFEPGIFGLDPASIKEGQRIRLDLAAYGIKPETFIKRAEKIAKKGPPKPKPTKPTKAELEAGMEALRTSNRLHEWPGTYPIAEARLKELDAMSDKKLWSIFIEQFGEASEIEPSGQSLMSLVEANPKDRDYYRGSTIRHIINQEASVREETWREREAEAAKPARAISEEAYKASLEHFRDKGETLYGGVPIPSVEDVKQAAIFVMYHVENGVRKLGDIIKAAEGSIGERAIRQAWRQTTAAREEITAAEKPTKSEAERKLLAQGHIAAKAEGLVDEKGQPNQEYRTLAKKTTGVESMADMTEPQMRQFIAAMSTHAQPVAAQRQKQADVAKDVAAESGLTESEISSLNKAAGSKQGYQQVLSYLATLGELPTEPQLRKDLLRDVEIIAGRRRRHQAKGVKKAEKGEQVDLLNPWSSARYAVAEAEARSATPLLSVFNDIVHHGREGQLLARDSIKALLKQHQTSFLGAAMHKDQSEQIIGWLFEENAESRAGLWSQMDDRTQSLAADFHSVLQGEIASEVREARWRIWDRAERRISEKIGDIERQIEEDPESTEKLMRRVTALEVELDGMKPPNAPDSAIKEGRAAKEAGQFKAWILTQTWGTRRHYFMSESEMADLLDSTMPRGVSERVAPAEPKVGGPPSQSIQELKTREGKPSPLRGQSVAFAILHHYEQIAVFNRTFDDIQTFWERFAAADPSKSDVRMMRNFFSNVLGRPSAANVPTKMARVVSRLFWRTYFIDPIRAAWYFTRNSFQNIAYLTSQLPLAEVMRAAPKVLVAQWHNPYMRADIDSMWRARISQKQQMHRQFLLMEEGNITAQTSNRVAVLLDILGQAAPFSDELNRLVCWPVMHQAAYDRGKQYVDGKISWNKLRRLLRLNTLNLAQQVELKMALARGDLHSFVSGVAEAKTENVHFRYQTELRSGVEQTPGGRTFLGLATFPRGTAEILYQNGLKPLWHGLATRDASRVIQGFGTLVMFFMGTMMARKLLEKLTGRKSYGLDTITRYTPLTPGAGKIVDLLDELSEIQWRAENGNWSAAKTADAVIGVGIGQLESFIPICSAYINYYENANDVRGVRLWSLVKKKAIEAYTEKTGREYRMADRTVIEKIQHQVFGGAEVPLQRDIEALKMGKPESEVARAAIAKRLRRAKRMTKEKYPSLSKKEIEQKAIQGIRTTLKNNAPNYGPAIKEVEYIRGLSPEDAAEKIRLRYEYLVAVDKALPNYGSDPEKMQHAKILLLAVDRRPTKSKFKQAEIDAKNRRTCWYLDAAGISETGARRLLSRYDKGDPLSDADMDKLEDKTTRMIRRLRAHRQSEWSIYKEPAAEKPIEQPQSMVPAPLQQQPYLPAGRQETAQAPSPQPTPPASLAGSPQPVGDIQKAQIRGSARAKVNMALMQGDIQSAENIAATLEQSGFRVEAVKARVRIASMQNDFATARALTLQLI